MINLNGVGKTFHQKGREIVALKPTTLHIKQGEIFGIVGYSGAGKSTLLRCINLLETPSCGEVIVDGQIVNKLNRTDLRLYRQKIGMIFQQFNLLSSKTVAENIAFNLKAGDVDSKEIPKRIDELLELVGLTDKKNVYPNQLSGGQKQRVGIAKALANNPKVLLCDEATSALDPITTKQILTLLKEINKKLGLTIILVTHEMEVIKQICDNVAVMESGQIIEQNSAYEIFSNPTTKLMKEFISNLHSDDDFEESLVARSKEETIIKVIFKGDAAKEPLIQTLANKYNVTTNILAGRIEYIQNKQLGSLTFSIDGEVKKCEDFINYLVDNVEDVEVRVYGK